MLLRRTKLESLALWGDDDRVLREDLLVPDMKFNVRNDLGGSGSRLTALLHVSGELVRYTMKTWQRGKDDYIVGMMVGVETQHCRYISKL